MGRPRGFDEQEVIAAAAALFAERSYDGTSIDDLVSQLGIHRNSLYKTFGSKRGLYLAALRWHLEHQVRPLIAAIGQAAELTDAFNTARAGGAELDLLLMAAVERAPADHEIATHVTSALDDLDRAIAGVLANNATIPETAAPADVLTAAVLGLRLRARAGTPRAQTAESP